MRTMAWPPDTVNGRIPLVEGPRALAVVVALTVSDLQANPFNDPMLSLGSVIFRTVPTATARIERALTRLSSIAIIDAIEQETLDEENGDVVYVIKFTDRETRTPAQVTING
jgi:hypothetical protein